MTLSDRDPVVDRRRTAMKTIMQPLRGVVAMAAILLWGIAGAGAARAETLVIYHALDFVGSAAKAFRAKTGIEVKLVEQGSTGEVLGKISAEGNNPQFDLVWIEGSAVMDRLAAAGILQALPELTGEIDYTDVGRKLPPASGFYFPTNLSTTAIAVNTKKVPADQMPKQWAHLRTACVSARVRVKGP